MSEREQKPADGEEMDDETGVVYYDGAPRIIRKARRRHLKTPAPLIRRNAVYFKNTPTDENCTPKSPYMMWLGGARKRAATAMREGTPLGEHAAASGGGENGTKSGGGENGIKSGGGENERSDGGCKRRALLGELKTVLAKKKSDEELAALLQNVSLAGPMDN